MRSITASVISGRSASTAYCDLEGSNVVFDACTVPRRPSRDGRTLIRNVALRNVVHINCDIHTANLEDVSLDGLARQGTDPLFLWGCVFNRVQIKGRIAGLKINRSISPVPGIADEERAAWDQLTIDFYRTVDWALDISDAKFPGSVSFEAIPGDKVRINEQTQALVTRSALQGTDWWRSYNFGVTPMKLVLSSFLGASLFDSVVVVARADRKYLASDLAAINALRAAGLAQ